MSREDVFRIGMALQSIALMVDDKTLNNINPQLREIEDIVERYVEK